MRVNRRAARLLVAPAVLVAVLSGCVRIVADTSINADDTFSQDVIIALTDAAAEQLGAQGGPELGASLDADAVRAQLAELAEQYPGQVTVTEYVDEDLEGVRIELTNVPLSELNQSSTDVTAGLGASASVERVGDQFVVTLVNAGAFDAADLPAGTPDLGFIESAVDVAVIYRFPGLVTEASAGVVEGNTVTLGLTDLAEPGEVRIVAGAEPAISWEPILRWGLIALAFAVIVGGGAALVIQDRRKQAASRLPIPESGTGGAGRPQVGLLGLDEDEPGA